MRGSARTFLSYAVTLAALVSTAGCNSGTAPPHGRDNPLVAPRCPRDVPASDHLDLTTTAAITVWCRYGAGPAPRRSVLRGDPLKTLLAQAVPESKLGPCNANFGPAAAILRSNGRGKVSTTRLQLSGCAKLILPDGAMFLPGRATEQLTRRVAHSDT
jgi:hypothetical protein